MPRHSYGLRPECRLRQLSNRLRLSNIFRHVSHWNLRDCCPDWRVACATDEKVLLGPKAIGAVASRATGFGTEGDIFSKLKTYVSMTAPAFIDAVVGRWAPGATLGLKSLVWDAAIDGKSKYS